MARPVGGAPQFDVPAAFKDPIGNCLDKVGVMQHLSPGRQRFVGGEDQRAMMQIAVVDDLEQDVGGVGPVAEIAHLVELCGAGEILTRLSAKQPTVSAAILNQRPPSAAKADGGAGRVILSKASHLLASARVFQVLDKTIGDLTGSERSPGSWLQAQRDRRARVC